MSNRDVQPFQFACPSCEETITFVIGSPEGALTGASDVVAFKAPFDGSNPFIDLHLDFPVSFGKYAMGETAFMKAVSEIGGEAYNDLKVRLSNLDILYSKQRDLSRLITQYKRGDVEAFKRVSKNIPGVILKSNKKEDVLAALYSATSIMSSPFTIHEHNKEISSGMPDIIQWLGATHKEKTTEFLDEIINNTFLKNLHHDCLGLYPKIIELELPLRPAFYYDYCDPDGLSKIPSRVSTTDFDACNNFYQDLGK